MKTLNEWAKSHGVTFVGRSAGLYTTGTVSAAALEEIFAEVDALRRERDELAARLETIVHILTRARLADNEAEK